MSPAIPGNYATRRRQFTKVNRWLSIVFYFSGKQIICKETFNICIHHVRV